MLAKTRFVADAGLAFGAFHRWIEVYYPDRGYVFSDPLSSVNGVDALPYTPGLNSNV